MKRNTGVLMLLAMLFAGSRLVTRPTHASSASVEERQATPVSKVLIDKNPSCPAFSDPDSDNVTGSEGKITSLVQRFLHVSSGDSDLNQRSLPEGIRFIVATVPDPLHTHLGLQFDRSLEALQQALQDEGYTYDSSWLPWKTQAVEYSSLGDRKAEEEETRHRELCPGLIAFRSSMNAPGKHTCYIKESSRAEPAGNSYDCGMLVFVVAETPTAGLNQAQWKNAQSWIADHASHDRPDKTLRILGPTFSGSMPSVIRALNDVKTSSGTFDNSLLYAGRIRGCASWKWLNEQVNKPNSLPVRTADFDENDAILIDRFYKYIADRGHALSEVAVLSEDETAYGGLPDPALKSSGEPAERAQAAQKNPTAETCAPAYGVATPPAVGSVNLPADDQKDSDTDKAVNRPVHLYYPRDISAVRSAYQEQSIFSSGSSGDSAPHTVLQPQSEQATKGDLDTIEPFGRQSLALTQEAQLYGIVNELRTHAIRYVVLRSTNSLDYLFLTRFLRRAYPDAYMVTMGTDMLFGRDVDSTEFRGVVALSAFPLLPRGQDWTVQTPSMTALPQHAHRVFSSDIMEGLYLAARFLSSDCSEGKGARECWEKPNEVYLHPSKADIPDYAEPFWDKDPNQLRASTWMGIIGREGYWPVAVLREPYANHHILSNLATVARPKIDDPNQGETAGGSFSLSSTWKFFCFITVVFVVMHFVASRWGWDRSVLAMFIQFTPLSTRRQYAIMTVGWATICSLVVMLLMASARIYPSLRSVDQFWVWVVGICSLFGCGAAVVDGQFMRLRPSQDEVPQTNPFPERSLFWGVTTLVLIGISVFLGWHMFDYGHGVGIVVAYRSVHLASGVSPIVSILLMLAGFYWWFWQSLEGLSLLGPGKPILPEKGALPRSLSRVSSEMADAIEGPATPIPSWNKERKWIYIVPLFLLAMQICVLQRPWSQGFDAVLHSLESKAFNWTLHGMYAVGLYLLILECMQLLLTWSSLKRLLLALNRLPLRRTFAALQGLSMQSLWSMSGTSSRSRYMIFSHQIESMVHLRNTLDSFDARHHSDASVKASLQLALSDGMKFINTRSKGADLAMSNNIDAFNIRRSFSRCTEHVFNELLFDEWFKESRSLDLKGDSGNDKSTDSLPLSESKTTRMAEEFVCLIYVGYLQNILARMRTMVLSMLGMFAVMALSVAFYPYTPRPLLSISLLFLLIMIGAVVAIVYAGLDRDDTLSHITNTRPGTLGVNFWIRLFSFFGVPAMGLIVAQFPEITDFFASWVQPTMNAVK